MAKKKRKRQRPSADSATAKPSPKPRSSRAAARDDDAPSDPPKRATPKSATPTGATPKSDRARSSDAPTTKKSALPPELAHDDREIDATNVIRFVAVTAALVAIALVAARYLERSFVSSEQTAYVAPLPMASLLSSAPAGPRLQRLPRQALGAFRAQQAQLRDSYGWIDRDKGIVRIPVDRAMELAVERGLPARAMPVESGPQVNTPNESSLAPPRGQP